MCGKYIYFPYGSQYTLKGFPLPPLPSSQSLEGIYHNNWNLMRKWKNAQCSYLPSSFPESCCWKGHKSWAALKQCCYLNTQNKPCCFPCYWKEESTAAMWISCCLAFRLHLTGEETAAQKWQHPTAGPELAWGTRKEHCSFGVLFYLIWSKRSYWQNKASKTNRSTISSLS